MNVMSDAAEQMLLSGVPAVQMTLLLSQVCVCVIVHVSVCAGRSLSAVLPCPVVTMYHMSPELLMVPLSSQRGYYFIASVLNLEKGLHAMSGLTFPTGSSLDSLV